MLASLLNLRGKRNRLSVHSQASRPSFVIGRSRTRQNSKLAIAGTYCELESRRLLAVLTVDTLSDVADGNIDGEISLREAIIATNTNAAFGDAPAGDSMGDTIQFDPSLSGQTITLSGSDISITDSLTIRGGSSGITIDANRESRIFDIDTSQPVRLVDLVLTHGLGDMGNAILVDGGGELWFVRSSFLNNGSDPGTFEERTGSAVYSAFSNLRVIDSTFDFNIGREGAAIHSESGSMIVNDSLFSNNFADTSGGAIWVADGFYYFGNTDFTDNKSLDFFFGNGVGSGGAIDIDGPSARTFIMGGSFVGNFASSGGAIGNSSGSTLDVRGGTLFHENGASGFLSSNGTSTPNGNGGAIFNIGELTLVDATLTSNGSAYGGAIYSALGVATLNRVELRSNRAQISGGGIAVGGGFVRIIDSMVGGSAIEDGNIAQERSSPQGPFGYGGGLSLLDSFDSENPSDVRFIGGSILNNSAHFHGGGVSNSSTSTLLMLGGTQIENNRVMTNFNFFDGSARGGGFYNSGTLLLSDVEIRGNRVADFGGGIFVDDGFVTVDNSVIAANQAGERGGGIELAGGSARLFQTTIGGSSLADGNIAGVYGADGKDGSGGGVAVTGPQGTRFQMIRGQVSFNSATLSGGGLWNQTGGIIRLDQGVNVNNNRALKTDGGGAYNDGGHFELRDAIFENNTARNGAGLFQNDGSASFSDSLVQSNTARRTGGGIFNRGFLRLTNTDVINNTAKLHPDLFDENNGG